MFLWHEWANFCSLRWKTKSSFLFFSLSAFMKQRRMGLNDFIQRIATNSYACKQWVLSDSCFCSALTWRQTLVNSQAPLYFWKYLTNKSRTKGSHREDELMNSGLTFVFYSAEVQSILNLSPPQEAELMNANPSPPVSIFTLTIDELDALFKLWHTLW